ncbi:unnamed protein product [Gordionus sp. m RMFG-2023]|uniref:NADH dehydrogenase [ubiquinone] 1 alpha subcomplex subunit 7-like n=1 Tax=Gordionus sp. m RMFG-2023 TaxID=3053472 RepID=UPI0030DE7D72
MGKESPAVYSTFILNLINWLIGRKFNNNMRYTKYVSSRSEPDPNLPPGPHAKLSENYYFQRDGRREINPPEEIFPIKKNLTYSNNIRLLKDKYLTQSDVGLFLNKLNQQMGDKSTYISMPKTK